MITYSVINEYIFNYEKGEVKMKRRSSLMTFEEFESLPRLFETNLEELKEDYKKYEMGFKYSRMSKKKKYEFFKENYMVK